MSIVEVIARSGGFTEARSRSIVIFGFGYPGLRKATFRLFNSIAASSSVIVIPCFSAICNPFSSQSLRVAWGVSMSQRSDRSKHSVFWGARGFSEGWKVFLIESVRGRATAIAPDSETSLESWSIVSGRIIGRAQSCTCTNLQDLSQTASAFKTEFCRSFPPWTCRQWAFRSLPIEALANSL